MTAPPVLYVGTDIWLVPEGQDYLPTHASLTPPALRRYSLTGMPVTLVARTLAAATTSVGRLAPGSCTVADLGLDDKSRSLGRRVALLVRALWSLPIRRTDVVVVRLPELVGTLLAVVARLRGAVLVCNVVAETRAVSDRFGRLEPVVRPVLATVVSRLVRSAGGTIFVTRRWLQQATPPPPHRPTLSASNVQLDEDDIAGAPRDFSSRPLRLPLVVTAVGDHNSPGKGHDLLIRACASLVRSGWSVDLHLVGRGPEQDALKELAQAEGIADVTTFHGYLADRDALYALLDATDFFVMPSRSEGLPRALVEAMSRGICCVGSRAGGIPELLEPEVLVDVDDWSQIVDRLRWLVALPAAELSALVEQQWRTAVETARGARAEVVAAFLRQVAQQHDAVAEAVR